MAEPGGDGFEHAPRLSHNLGPNSVTREEDDSGVHGCYPQSGQIIDKSSVTRDGKGSQLR
jgi:hypothetical protein